MSRCRGWATNDADDGDDAQRNTRRAASSAAGTQEPICVAVVLLLHSTIGHCDTHYCAGTFRRVPAEVRAVFALDIPTMGKKLEDMVTKEPWVGTVTMKLNATWTYDVDELDDYDSAEEAEAAMLAWFYSGVTEFGASHDLFDEVVVSSEGGAV